MSEIPTWYVGNRNPAITDTLTIDGEPYDLNAVSATVKFKMRALDSSTLKVDAAATIIQTGSGISAVDTGQVAYAWEAADVDTAGYYLCWFEVTVTGKVQGPFCETLIQIAEHAPLSNVYVQPEEIKTALTAAGTTYLDRDLERAIKSASRAMDRLCGRRFFTTTSDETRRFTAVIPRKVDLVDVLSITSVATDEDGDGTYETSWTSSDYTLAPYNFALDSRPYTHLVVRPTASRRLPVGIPAGVRVIGKFGWDAPPDEIVQCTTILAVQMLQRVRMAPWGVIAVGLDQSSAFRLARHDAQIMSLSEDYRRSVIAA